MLRTLSTSFARAAASGTFWTAASAAVSEAAAAASTSGAAAAALQVLSSRCAALTSSSGGRHAFPGCNAHGRGFMTSATAQHGGHGEPEGETIEVTFINLRDDSEKTVRAAVGESLMEAAHRNDVELEGACEGSLACSTCHIVLEEEVYESLEEPCEDEMDMLDLAFGLTETSRLGCQVIATKELDGVRAVIPSATRNFAVDGYVPKPH